MRIRSLFSALVAVVLLLSSGCGWSLWPFYTATDLSFDEALLGTWYAPGSGEALVVSSYGENAYRIEQRDREGRSAVLLGHLFKLETERFLDVTVMPEWLWPEDDDPSMFPMNPFARHHLVAVHTVLRVDEINENLVLAALDPQWVDQEDLPKDQVFHFAAFDDEVLPLLGVSTKRLQKLLRKAMRDPEAIGPDIELHFVRTLPETS